MWAAFTRSALNLAYCPYSLPGYCLLSTFCFNLPPCAAYTGRQHLHIAICLASMLHQFPNVFCACSMVITAPVVGKLSRQSLEQIVGTLVGGISGYLTWMVIDAYQINKDGFLLSLCLSFSSAAVGFFNVVVEESLSDANMTALTFLSVVFGTTDSSTGNCTCRAYKKAATERGSKTATLLACLHTGCLCTIEKQVVLCRKTPEVWLHQ